MEKRDVGRAMEPRAAKMSSKTTEITENDVKSAASSPEKSEEQSEATENGGDESMKTGVLDDASRMLKSMNEGDDREERMQIKKFWACRRSGISSRKPESLQVVHPVLGKLDVMVESGCPMVSQGVATKLIDEIEAKAVKVVKSLRTGKDSEVAWLKRLADEHPALQGIPEEIKLLLNLILLGNRGKRKVWRTKGGLRFSRRELAYTLGRAFQEIGGERRLLHGFDITHDKPTADRSPGGEAYPLLLRAALDGWVKGWIGGPPCTTRSALRHLEVPGESMPKPLESWNGGEFGRRAQSDPIAQ